MARSPENDKCCGPSVTESYFFEKSGKLGYCGGRIGKSQQADWNVYSRNGVFYVRTPHQGSPRRATSG